MLPKPGEADFVNVTSSRATIRSGLALALVFLLAACGGSSDNGGAVAPPTTPPVIPPVEDPVLPGTYVPSGRTAAGDVFVHLFEWRWQDIARECESWLGPKGFKAVQISPPMEHLVIATGITRHPWWQRYQPVSYKLDNSRSGTVAQFSDMIARCRAVGVDIYVDAVINHMTAGSGTGSAGSTFTKYDYPAVPYTQLDFHTPCAINSYNNAQEVQRCELVGLSDLRTEDDSVRAKISRYLIALNQLGVAGFRVDAAKHMRPRDVDNIFARVNAAALAAGRPRPYVFLEIPGSASEAVTADQYYGVGFASGGSSDVTDFQYGGRLADAFLGRNGGSLAATLSNFTTGLFPSDKSVVFVDNHDTQRGDALYYADAAYLQATVFMLAHPQGYPSVMSSYGFDRGSQAGRDQGPPSDGSGVTNSTFGAAGSSLCTATLGAVQQSQWICEHRNATVAAMVAFRKATVGAPISTCGRAGLAVGSDNNRIAFCRDGAGFVAMSRGAAGGVELLQTRLPAGTYCNVAQFDFIASSGGAAARCTGPGIVVDAAGNASVTLTAGATIALHTRARL